MKSKLKKRLQDRDRTVKKLEIKQTELESLKKKKAEQIQHLSRIQSEKSRLEQELNLTKTHFQNLQQSQG